MKTELARVLLAVVFALSLASGVRAQQVPSDEAQIRQYRDDIKLLLDNAPSPGSPEEAQFRSSLSDLRMKLRDLLVERRGALKSKLQNLQSQGASAEVQAYANRLASELGAVNAEANVIDRALTQGGAPVAPTSTPAPGAAAGQGAEDKSILSKADSETLKQARALLDSIAKERADLRAATANAVNLLTDPRKGDQLKAAAAPAEVAASAEGVTPRCVNGTAFFGPGASATQGSLYDTSICSLARQIIEGLTVKREISLAQHNADLYSILIPKLLKTTGDASFVSFVTEAQEKRTDQQLGASPSSNGTTSLVSKGGIPYVFAFAVENGAATQTQDDTTVTLRFNPAGLINTFAQRGFITGFRATEDDPVLKFLRKTSVGLTFDTTRGDNPGVFTGDRQQLSEVNVKFEFVNQRDPRHRRYQRDWERFVATQGVALAGQVWKTTIATIDVGGGELAFADPALQAWLVETNGAIAKVSPTLDNDARINAVAEVIRRQADLVPVELVGEQTVEAISSFARQFKEYTDEKNRLLGEIAKGNVFTFDYTNKREVNAPDTSNFRFIAAKGLQSMGRTLDFTANGSLTFFHDRPTPANPGDPAPGRVRDFQFAGQVDVPFKVGDVGQFVFWFSGRYERLLEDASAPGGGTVAGTKGDIAVGQFGLKVPMPGLGMHLPLSFTFANRTELVKEKEVRGNFGFTFNLDTIMSRLKPF